MKKIILTISAALMACASFAQTPFANMTKGSTLTYQELDQKGKVKSSYSDTVTEVTGGENNTWFVTTEKVYSDVNVPSMTLTSKITRGTVKAFDALTAASNGSQLDVTFDGFIPTIPCKLAAGQVLGTGVVEMTIGGMTTEVEITDNNVVAEETLTTPAGTFECFVIETKVSSRVLGMTVKGTAKNWYARGIGCVKSESYNAKGKVTASRILVETKGL